MYSPTLVLAALLLASPCTSAVPWYQNAVIYQVYPRSFMDSTGDGIGDLTGLINKVDYLKDLGVDAVWLSPIYSSPNEDFGYDISDFINVDPEYGTLDTFKRLLTVLNKRGIKLLLDFVPNHTSTKHKWFIWSESRNGSYADYYVWRNASGTDSDNKPKPPNNWLDVMSTGSAWMWSEKRQQFYLHNFLEHQADLNYANPDVLQEMKHVLKFWMERGVAGFRLDAVSWLYEDQSFPDEPPSKHPDPLNPIDYNNLDHIYTQDLPESCEIAQAFRKTIDDYTKSAQDMDERILIVESYSEFDKVMKYYGTAKAPGATFPFNFFLAIGINRDSNVTEWSNGINKWLNDIGDGHWPNWVLGNHDQSRITTKFSADMIDLFHMLSMTLKGTAITYYGEEIGLTDAIVRWDQTKDIQGLAAGRAHFREHSRDAERSPFPWDQTSNGGFTKGRKPWLPLTPDYWRVNQARENEELRSHLKVYKDLVALRKQPTLTYGDCVVLSTDDQLIVVIRSFQDNPTYVTVVNVGTKYVESDISDLRSSLPQIMTLRVASVNYGNYDKKVVDLKKIQLPPQAGVVLISY